MLKISKQNNALIVIGENNDFYVNNGQNSYPLNSLIVVTDNSDMATFRSVATNDVLFSGLINNITINGEVVTKDNIIEKFDTVSNSSTGGGTVDAYTKEEADNKFASKDELTNVQTVANDADTKVDALTPRVEGVETAMNDKQDLLVSGTNIKTINNQSILGEGNIEISDYYTKTEADEIFATTTQVNHQAADISALQTDMRGKQATLVSGENIKTINSQSILGSGDLTISGVSEEQAQEIAKIPTLETALNNKQDTLVSGTNIKTVNSQSILGEGNIEVSGVSDEQAQEIAKIPTIETELAQKANTSDVPTLQTDRIGTNKNYVYSDPNTSYTKVISNIYLAPSADKIEMWVYDWLPNDSNISLSRLNLSTATTTKAGVMSAADKTKLDSIPETIPSQSEIDGIAANVSALQTAMDGKQPTLVSGTNIKTINGNSILGEGNLVIEGGGIDLSNYYNKTEVDTKLDTKQNTLVSGTNIKTINGESVLGEGNIEVSGGAKIYNADEINSNFNEQLKKCVDHLNTGEDYTYNMPIVSDETIYDNFFNNIKYGDFVLINPKLAFSAETRYLCEYRGKNGGFYRFVVILYKYDKLSNFTADISIRYTKSQDSITFNTNNGGPAAKITDIPNTDNFATKNELTAVETSLGNKQDTLVSGTNIKTINSQSILGEGNLEVSGVSDEQAQEIAKIPTLETEIAQKANTSDVPTVQTGESGTNKNYIFSSFSDSNYSVFSKFTFIPNERGIQMESDCWGSNHNRAKYFQIPLVTTSQNGVMSAADKTKLDSLSNEWTGTQSEYDALATKDNNTIYYVTE